MGKSNAFLDTLLLLEIRGEETVGGGFPCTDINFIVHIIIIHQ